MEHSRAGMLHLIPHVGDTLLTNRRRPILTLLEDTAGNVHDTLMAACDRWRYEGLGCTGITTTARTIWRRARRHSAWRRRRCQAR